MVDPAFDRQRRDIHPRGIARELRDRVRIVDWHGVRFLFAANRAPDKAANTAILTPVARPPPCDGTDHRRPRPGLRLDVDLVEKPRPSLAHPEPPDLEQGTGPGRPRPGVTHSSPPLSGHSVMFAPE